MSEETKKEYTNEMRGTLWAEAERKNDKAPAATGTVTISGVELRIAMWPKRVASPNSKAAGRAYWPIAVEYKQGATHFLAKVAPSNVLVTGATADAAGSAPVPVPGEAPTPSVAVDDMPF